MDVLIIGGGHAGLEAAAAAARLGASTTLVTLDARAIGRLSCNPAIGGVGKGHLVRELWALGALMPDLADRTGIQFRLLNTSRGPAVRGPRAQVDRLLYPAEAQRALAALPIEVLEDEVTDLLVDERGAGSPRCVGAILRAHGVVEATRVVLTSGTFLGGVLHVGAAHGPGGRRGEGAATALSRALAVRGVPLERFKTGTPPRLLAESIDFAEAEEQRGDHDPTFFCPDRQAPALPQVSCHGVYTNPAAHAVIREAMPRSPLAAGRITGSGPRYCPSFEEKVVRFADRDRHLLVIEPEGLDHPEVYLNGASTSLPEAAQRAFIRHVPALRAAEITQLGYAVEYDHVPPREVDVTLALRRLPGLHLAGQVLGTTGYEEAAALGLVAGANAALAARGRAPLVLRRDQAYVGVLVDDLVTRGIDEPYRMFTSRAEHRLTLGIDSADLRLAELAASVGLASEDAASRAREKRRTLESAIALLGTRRRGDRSLADVARRPEVTPTELLTSLGDDAVALGATTGERLEILRQAIDDLRYSAYRRRQERQAERLVAEGPRSIPAGFRFEGLPGLSREVQERLERARPMTLEQASRLPGVTPAALQVLHAHVARAGEPR